ALAGDPQARRTLRTDVYGALLRAGGHLLETLDTYFACGGVLEGVARSRYVHPNTVRYPMGRGADVSGLAPTDPRPAAALRLALTLRRLDPPEVSGSRASRTA